VYEDTLCGGSRFRRAEGLSHNFSLPDPFLFQQFTPHLHIRHTPAYVRLQRRRSGGEESQGTKIDSILKYWGGCVGTILNVLAGSQYTLHWRGKENRLKLSLSRDSSRAWALQAAELSQKARSSEVRHFCRFSDRVQLHSPHKGIRR